ncbi:unnamed protein product [Zymoseptoria tritici ST99CH_3D1]|nr:unnamed protein product [Zymoseptoria tritici ST99CH_3D1]
MFAFACTNDDAFQALLARFDVWKASTAAEAFVAKLQGSSDTIGAVVQTDGRGYVPDGYVLRGTKEMAVRDDEVMEVMEAVEMGMEWVELAGVEEARVEVAEVVQVQVARARVVEMGVTQVRAVKPKKLSWFPSAARLAVAASVEVQVGCGEMARRGTGVRAATTLTGPMIKPERSESSGLGVGVGRAEWRRW